MENQVESQVGHDDPGFDIEYEVSAYEQRSAENFLSICKTTLKNYPEKLENIDTKRRERLCYLHEIVERGANSYAGLVIYIDMNDLYESETRRGVSLWRECLTVGDLTRYVQTGKTWMDTYRTTWPK
jgi:hypothetical protein